MYLNLYDQWTKLSKYVGYENHDEFDDKMFSMMMKNFTDMYKKADYKEQGEFHHLVDESNKLHTFPPNRRIMPNIIVNDFEGVSPMVGPSNETIQLFKFKRELENYRKCE